MLSAREVAIHMVVAWGFSREWAEEHVGEAVFTEEGVAYDLKVDKPVNFIHLDLTVPSSCSKVEP